MLISIHTKNMALEKTVEIDSNIVPRTGETFRFDIDGINKNTCYLVHEVEYVCDGKKITPLVSCHADNPQAHRRIVLEEHGWL